MLIWLTEWPSDVIESFQPTTNLSIVVLHASVMQCKVAPFCYCTEPFVCLPLIYMDFQFQLSTANEIPEDAKSLN